MVREHLWFDGECGTAVAAVMRSAVDMFGACCDVLDTPLELPRTSLLEWLTPWRLAQVVVVGLVGLACLSAVLT